MELTRRGLLTAAAGSAGVAALAGCTGDPSSASGSQAGGPTVRASFFVFGDIAARVAGDAAETDLLVPIGQHGHGWEPGPSVREEIHEADLFVHGMEGFQPWVDNINRDLEADGSDVALIDASAGVSLLESGGGGDDHADDEHSHDDDDHEHEHGDGTDPHFWMDPIRVKQAVNTVRDALVDIDPDNADAYTDNAETLRDRLDGLDEEIESTVSNASSDVILVAGHNSFGYFSERYGVDVEALTGLSPDDRPTPRDIQRARESVQTHGLRYICADPLESQQAAEQLASETDVEEVLPLTAMPGLRETWDENGWGYVDVMENVNLPTIERVLNP